MPTAASARALRFLYLTVILDVLAFGIVVPVLPSLVASFLHNDTVRAANMWGLFGSAYAAAQFLFSPILGSLSDRFGRRPVILLALVGLVVDYIVMAAAPTLAWLWFGRITSGICGATYTTAGAYIADVTEPEKRASAFGMIGAAWGLGFVLGPALGGALGAHDPRLPFWVAGALTAANAVYGYFALPESLPRDRREPFSWTRANPLGSLRLLRSSATLAGLAVVQFCYQLAHQVLPAVYVLYVGHRYGWSARRTGITLAIVGVTSSVVQGGIIRPVVKKFGERTSAMIGLGCAALASVLYGVASTPFWFMLGIPFGSLAGLYAPSAQALMSARVSPEEQGQLQGALGSLGGVAGMLGPTLFGASFAYAIAPGMPSAAEGAPFYIAGVIQLLGLIGVLAFTRAHASGHDARAAA